MASLKQFLGLNIPVSMSHVFVYKTTQVDVTDGGQCCLYTVPASSSYVHVEMWGGGGGGSGACCCQWAYGQPSPGMYVKKRFSVTAGDALTICAASSTCCGPNCKGPDGFPSFLTRSGTTLVCAPGGFGGCALCFYKGGFPCTGLCVPGNRTDQAACADLAQCVMQGMSPTHNFCASDFWEGNAGSPKYAQNLRLGGSTCAYEYTKMGCCKNANHWPAGGGNGAGSCGGGCCWGGWGAGGLVILTIFS
jgi:hypothetical protein